MSGSNYRIEFKGILERIFLPEGISSEEMKEKLLHLCKNRVYRPLCEDEILELLVK